MRYFLILIFQIVSISLYCQQWDNQHKHKHPIGIQQLGAECITMNDLGGKFVTSIDLSLVFIEIESFDIQIECQLGDKTEEFAINENSNYSDIDVDLARDLGVQDIDDVKISDNNLIFTYSECPENITLNIIVSSPEETGFNFELNRHPLFKEVEVDESGIYQYVLSVTFPVCCNSEFDMGNGLLIGNQNVNAFEKSADMRIIREASSDIYPNPAFNAIKIYIDRNIKEIHIVNSHFEFLKSINIKDNEVYENIDLREYISGVYYVLFVTNEGEYSLKKIIKN